MERASEARGYPSTYIVHLLNHIPPGLEEPH